MTATSKRFVLVPAARKQDFSTITDKAITYADDVVFAFEFEIVKIKSRESKDRAQADNQADSALSNSLANEDNQVEARDDSDTVPDRSVESRSSRSNGKVRHADYDGAT